MKSTLLKWLFMMKSKLILLLGIVLLTSCGCSGKKDGPAQPVSFKRFADGVPVRSEVLGQDISLAVLLPASYVSEPKKRYPVVYCLHGLGDEPASWNDQWLSVESTVKSLEASGLEEMIYVFPQGFRTYYVNYYTGKYNYMDFFVNELIPYVDKTWRTKADRGHRAVTGYSMGGFGAWVLAGKHPELFIASAPLSMSFRTDAQYMTESQSGWNDQWGRIFGGVGMAGEARLTNYYKDHCPFYQFIPANKDRLSQVRWFLTCGDDEEQLLIANDDLHVQLRDNGTTTNTASATAPIPAAIGRMPCGKSFRSSLPASPGKRSGTRLLKRRMSWILPWNRTVPSYRRPSEKGKRVPRPSGSATTAWTRCK